MRYQIHIELYKGQPFRGGLRPLIFGVQGCRIGRSSQCDFVLEDDTRVVSRVQAQINVQKNGVLIWEQKGGNPSVHNGVPVCVGQTVEIAQGDCFEVGDYRLRLMELMPAFDDVSSPVPTAQPDPEPQPEIPSVPTQLFLSPTLVAETSSPELPNQKPVFQVQADLPPESPQQVPAGKPLPAADVNAEPSVSSDAAINRLLEGLGLPADYPLQPNQVVLLGQLMRASIDGLIDLLALRSAFRREMRSESTVIGTGDNNPLKYCPNGQEALRRMLALNSNGYVDAQRAVEEAMVDLSSHFRGMTKALDEGFTQVAHELDPAEIMREAQDKGLVKMQKQAHAWALYEQRYRDRFGRGHDAFHSAMGEVFRKSLGS